MEEFKGNSNASKVNLHESNVKPVTTNVVIKKEGEATKFRKRFFAEDAKTVGGHVVESVVIPSLQKLLSDAVKGAIDWLIYGSKGNRSATNTFNGISYTNYWNRGLNNSPVYSNPMVGNNQASQTAVFAVNNVIFPERAQAEEVLLRMKEAIFNYGMVSVADFVDLIGQRCPFTDQKWGWRDLSGADVIRVNDGFSIRFPKVIPIEN